MQSSGAERGGLRLLCRGDGVLSCCRRGGVGAGARRFLQSMDFAPDDLGLTDRRRWSRS